MGGLPDKCVSYRAVQESVFWGCAGCTSARLKRPVRALPKPAPLLYRESNSTDMKNIFYNKDFWKDALLFLGVLCLFYLIYVVVEYWPEITQGFNRGWSGE